MKLADLNNELSAARERIDAHENEIRYLEEVLLTTSGPARDICDELERNQVRLRELRNQASLLHNQIAELKVNET